MWDEMKPTQHQGQYKSTCQKCGTVIYGSAWSRPLPADLEFQDILEDCDEQLARRVMES